MLAQVSHRSSGPQQRPFPSSGDVVNERYQLVRELGRGGMGIVVQAHDAWLGRDVALKVLRGSLVDSPEGVERFEREARTLASMSSPHVVRVLDYGFVQSPASGAGLPFMVLELLKGEDLYDLAQRTTLSVDQVVRYALQVCSGLTEAHEQGIVHRDLKPENLFVAIERDGSECMKILDFGIARSHRRRVQTLEDCSLGSPGYMAPEQVQDPSSVGPAADIWSLGVVMYELLSHRAAFPGATPEVAIAQVLAGKLPPLDELEPDVPRGLIAVIERCMQPSPDRRFANVTELAVALGELDAEPAGDFEEAPKPRRRYLAWLAAALILGPSLWLLPEVANAPELAPARAWAGRAVDRAEATLQAAVDRAKGLRKP
jgi:eukaryotic-like serine/threonine-protein kinase